MHAGQSVKLVRVPKSKRFGNFLCGEELRPPLTKDTRNAGVLVVSEDIFQSRRFASLIALAASKIYLK